jgi:Holliday junction resolvase RusA-like endonuclease
MTIGVYTVTLPLPPSVNGLYANVRGKGRVPTKRYRMWKNLAGWDLKFSGLWAVRGPVKITIAVPTKAPADVDNYAKALLDILVTHQRIDDDKHVQSVSISRCGTVAPRKCRVMVRPA